ncbi:hypothetical protein ABT052_47945 [Streptomyces sp. NPDC002766]|uniref:hypothetical protein n=1 Tax=unclassified Streptomyces TaxID=2593676 RepID=UPI00332EA6B5
MRPYRTMLCAVLSVGLTACGAVDGGVRVEGQAPTAIPRSGPVYVEDHYGRAWQRPGTIVLTELILLDRMKWRGWGSSRAQGTGELSDPYCQSGCSDGDSHDYQVQIVLSGQVRRGSVAYYGQATLTPVHPPAPDWAKGFGSTQLDVPDS